MAVTMKNAVFCDVNRVALVRTDVLEELSAFIILVTLMKEALCSSETPVLTRATGYSVPDDAILHNFIMLTNRVTLRTGMLYAKAHNVGL
jgi:hypothetical protein